MIHYEKSKESGIVQIRYYRKAKINYTEIIQAKNIKAKFQCFRPPKSY